MTRYLDSGPMSFGGGFGTRKHMRCSNNCGGHKFVQRKARVIQIEGNPDELICYRCGAPAREEKINDEVPMERQQSDGEAR